MFDTNDIIRIVEWLDTNHVLEYRKMASQCEWIVLANLDIVPLLGFYVFARSRAVGTTSIRWNGKSLRGQTIFMLLIRDMYAIGGYDRRLIFAAPPELSDSRQKKGP